MGWTMHVSRITIHDSLWRAAMPDTILLDQREGVLTITLNRPDVLNAFNEQMLRELHATLRHAARDATVRCGVLIGAGRGVCSGPDLRSRAGTTAFFFRR